MMRRFRLGALALIVFTLLVVGLAGPLAQGSRPGPGSKQCTPGQNNVGGGPGNSGPGDKHGAPLKPPPSCPGHDH